MTLTAIILVILLGIILLILEILVIPGFGIAGIAGVALMLAGIFFAYRINNATGHIIFASSFLCGIGLIALSLRAKTWNRVMLKTEIKSKVNILEGIHAGDIGITVSRIAPMGKIKVGEHFAEASALSEFINENTVIQVVKVEPNKIIVKEINHQ